MQAFEFYCPTKIYFGKGAEARVGEAVKHFGGTKVFIVYGGHSAVKSGLIARIEQTLTDAGLEVAHKIYERHTVLSNLLIHLGVSEEVAVEDACKLEHDISDETFAAIKEHVVKNIDTLK